MARLCSIATGNNTSASTWALIDSTSFNESETSNITAPTSYSTGYTQFTPGVITIDAIGLRVNNRTGTTGTFSVELYNHTLGMSVAGTEVTVNCSDFVDAIANSLDGGWMMFKFGSPVTLLAATNYSVRFKTSNSTQIVIQSSTTTNPCRMLRTTTTQAPVAGDDRFIMGEWTAAATTNTFTVTADDTSTVDYGSASTSLVTPALSISAGGSYIAGTSASTTYVQKLSGNLIVYNGGKCNVATSGSRMDSTSSFTFSMDCVSATDFVAISRRKGEIKWYGESKTRWTKLNGDHAASATVITVLSTSGWKVGDTLIFTPTGTTVTQTETKTILTVDSSTQVTLTAGLTNAHTGTGDVVGEVGNLTSNVVFQGVSSTIGTSMTFKDSSIGYLDNVSFKYIGNNTASDKRGLEVQHSNTAINSVTVTSCAIESSSTSGIIGTQTSTCAFFYFTYNVLYAYANAGGYTFSGGRSGTPTFQVENNLAVGSNTGNGSVMGCVTGGSGTFASNISAGFSTGFLLNTSFLQDTDSTLTSCIAHSNGSGFNAGACQQKKILISCSAICNSTGMSNMGAQTVFDSCNIIGNSTTGVNTITNSFTGTVYDFYNCTFRGRTGFAQPSGIGFSSNLQQNGILRCRNCTFGSSVAHTTADVNITGVQWGVLIFDNCTFASTTEFNSTVYAFLDENAYIGIQRLDTTAGNHKTFIRYGIITPDTSIYKTASPSIRVAPKSATIACSTILKSFKVPVASGQTCTPTVYVRESEVGDGTAYNGNRVKLYVKANYNAGITSDTLLDTATASSDGAWEGLTGTTAAVTDDVVLEFYLTCDGTTGWINIDDFSATVA